MLVGREKGYHATTDFLHIADRLGSICHHEDCALLGREMIWNEVEAAEG